MSILKKNITKNKEIKLSTYARWVLVVILIVSAVFSFSAFERWGYVDRMSPLTHDWMTASTIKFANNWLHEGAIDLGFLLIENPKSVEFPTLESRNIYMSYMPTCVIPVYLVCKVMGMDANPLIVRTINVLNHYFLTVILSLTAFYFMRRVKYSYKTSALFAGTTALLLSYLSGPYYFMSAVYWSDMAVLPYFALILMIETVCWKDTPEKNKRILDAVYFCAMFIGCMIDWLMFFVAATAFFARLFIRREKFIKTFILTAVPVILAIGMFLLYINFSGLGFSEIVDRFLLRIGAAEREYFVKNLTFFRRFFRTNIVLNFNLVGSVLIILSFAAYIIYTLFYLLGKKKTDKQNYILNILTMAFLPCLFQIAVFSDHSYGHNFSALKMTLPFVLSSFTMLPMFIMHYYGISHKKDLVINFRNIDISLNYKDKVRKYSKINVISVLMIAAILSFSVYSIGKRNISHEYMANKTNVDYTYNYSLEKYIKGNANYYDFLVSPHYIIPENDPVRLSFSNKRMYYAPNVGDIDSLIESYDLSKAAVINIYIISEDEDKLSSDYKELLGTTDDIKDEITFKIYKFSLPQYIEASESIVK